MMRRSAFLHGTFRASIMLKGVDGVLETIGGARLHRNARAPLRPSEPPQSGALPK